MKEEPLVYFHIGDRLRDIKTHLQQAVGVIVGTLGLGWSEK